MKTTFLKSATAKRAIAFVLLFALVVPLLCGCGSRKSKNDSYYSKSERAVMAIEDAIYLLERCMTDKITPEECAE